MHVISFKILREYSDKEPLAKAAFKEWYKKAEKADWKSFADMRKSFNSVDNIGNGRYVFNVKGNHYRIISVVRFKFKKVLIRWFGNHKEYDNLKNIDTL